MPLAKRAAPRWGSNRPPSHYGSVSRIRRNRGHCVLLVFALSCVERGERRRPPARAYLGLGVLSRKPVHAGEGHLISLYLRSALDHF